MVICVKHLSLNITKYNVTFHAINKPKFPFTILINKQAIDQRYGKIGIAPISAASNILNFRVLFLKSPTTTPLKTA